MNLFQVRHDYGHVWLLYRGVVIWKLSRDRRSSYLMQVAPRTTELLSEGP